MTKKFPIKFFIGVFAVMVFVVVHTKVFYKILPRNTFSECKTHCSDENVESCIDFCECIHKIGKSLEKCLEEFNKTD